MASQQRQDADQQLLLIPGTQGEKLLRSVIAVIFVSCLVGFVMAPILVPDQPLRMVGLGLFALTAGIARYLVRAGDQQRAILVMAWGGWSATVAACVVVDGLHTPVFQALPVVVLLGGGALGLRQALLLTVASCLAILVLGGFEILGHYGNPGTRDTVLRAIVALMVLTFAAGVMRYLMAGNAIHRKEVRALTDALAEQLAQTGRRESELAESILQHQALIDAQSQAGVGVEIIQAGRVTYANDALCRLLGYTREELLALERYDLIVHPDDHERVTRNHLRRLRGETFENRYEIQVITRRGETREVEITVAPLQLPTGPGVMVILVDISERRRAQSELAQSRELFSHAFTDSPVAISFSRLADGRYIDCNDAFLRIVGWSRGDVVGHRSLDIGLWPDPGKRDEWVGRLRAAGQITNDPITLRDHQGRTLAILITSTLVRVGGETLAMSFLHDVTELRRAEQELHSSEERFSRVFQAIPITTLLTRAADGRYIDVNEAFTRQMGWTREEAIGRTSLDIGIWRSAEDRRQWIDSLGASNSLRDYELDLRSKSGEIRHTLVSAEMVDFGGESCIVSLIHDVTDRTRAMRLLAASEQKFALTFHASPVAISLTRLDDGYCVDVNQAYIDQFGWAREEMVGHTMSEIGLWPSADARQRWVTALRDSGGHMRNDENVLLNRAGEPRTVLASAEIVDYQGQKHALVYVNDVTEQRKAEQVVRDLNASLEARVRERTAQLSEVNQELESFAYSISHDLRAPLRGIDGFSRLLQEEYGAHLDPPGQDYLSRVRRAAQRMGNLIDDLLDLSRVTRMELETQNVDLSALAREILAGLAEGDPERQVETLVGSGCRAAGDPRLLRVLLENLLGNAWKYTYRAPGARIEFGGEKVGAGETACYAFFVRDNGAGFDMTYADKLFTPFQRLHSPTDFEGSGIGLASCARVVRRHGGRIWGDGAPGQGATFWFTLPPAR